MTKAGLDQPLMKLPAMKATVAEVAVKHAMSHAKLDLQTPISLSTEHPAEHLIWAWLLGPHLPLHQSHPATVLCALASHTRMAPKKPTCFDKVAVELPPANRLVVVSI